MKHHLNRFITMYLAQQISIEPALHEPRLQLGPITVCPAKQARGDYDHNRRLETETAIGSTVWQTTKPHDNL